MSTALELLERISQSQDPESYHQEHWQGSFTEYLDIVRAHPQVRRTAYQRMYDMITSYGTYEIEGKDGLIRYRFFDDVDNDGQNAIFGLTRPLMELVNVFRAAALGYGSERRVLLLHGPVGSSKSTIARPLKRGLERYSRTEEGALYSYGWKEEDGSIANAAIIYMMDVSGSMTGRPKGNCPHRSVLDRYVAEGSTPHLLTIRENGKEPHRHDQNGIHRTLPAVGSVKRF